MTGTMRFGRRVPLPSTAQIRHDLLQLIAEEKQRGLYAAADGLPADASWMDIGRHRAALEETSAASALQGQITDARAVLHADEKASATFQDEPASPAKGVAALRQGLSENTLRTLVEEQRSLND